MFNVITSVKVVKKYVLSVTFADGKIFTFEMDDIFKKYPAFKKLKRGSLFKKVQLTENGYTIYWDDELDISSDYIYNHGRHSFTILPNLNVLVGERIADRRNELEMSQRELSRTSKIPQAEISKIEAGKGNPTVSTLQRIANALQINPCELLLTVGGTSSDWSKK